MSDLQISEVICDGLSNPQKFIQKYRILAALKDWDATVQLENLELFLKGKALQNYNQTSFKKTSIKEAFESLKTACAPDTGALLNQFYNRKKEANESIASYAYALKSLLSRACPDMSDAHSLPILKNQLTKELPEVLRIFVTFNASLTWEDLVKGLENTSGSAISNGQSAPQYPQVKEESIDFNYSSANNRNQRNQHGQQNQSRGQTCFYCRLPGHVIRDCRKKKRDEQNGGGDNNSKRSNWNSNAAKNNSTEAEEEFKFFASNNITEATMGNTYSEGDGKLDMLSAKFSFMSETNIRLKGLVDNGSTHSFISPDKLTRRQMEIAKSNDERWCTRRNMVINGSTGAAKSLCCITRAEIEIGPWRGTHNFVISHAVTKYDMVLGKDFLSTFKVKQDHGNRTIKIDGHSITLDE